MVFPRWIGLSNIGAVEIFEEGLGKPLITNHPGNLLAFLGHSRNKDKLPGLGRLFTI